MTDFYLPQDISPGEVQWGAVESSAVFAADTTGAIRSSEIVGGNALNPTFVWPPLKDQSATERQRSRLIAVMRALRGQANRIWMPVPGHEEPSWAPELLSNNTFANGTTGWTADNCTLTVVDRVARLTVTTPAANVQIRQAVALTQYAPHVLRGFIIDGPQTSGLNIGPSLTLGAAQSSQGYSTARGLKTVVGVAEDATSRFQFPAVFSSVTGFAAGAYLSVPYTSLSRCALVDNSPNAFPRSDELENAYWSATGLDSRTANNATAPDGTSTADTLVEDSAASQHNINKVETRTSAAEDWCAGCYVKRGAGTRNFGLVIGENGVDYVRATFNLGTGAVNSVTNNGDAGNGRAFIVSAGNGWYLCYVVARLAATSTAVLVQADILDGSFAVSYTGDGTSSLQLWRLGAARSGVPLRLGQTTTAATTGTAQTGTGMYVKGLPASTNDLRKAGHWVQIGRELHQLAASLNSDAAGMAFMQLCNPPRNAPADNDPVIFNNPMGKFLQAKNVFNWKDMPGLFSDFEVEFLEATAG